VGLIQQKMRAGANQRVAAARVIQIAGAPEDFPAALQALINQWNTEADAAFETAQAKRGKVGRWIASSDPAVRRHFDMKVMADNSIALGYGVTVQRVLDGKYSKASFATTHGWVAAIMKPEPAGDGRSSITVSLRKWAVNDSGFIWNGSRYIQLLDGLIAMDGHYVSNPPDEQDFQFVRQEGLRTIKG
jgi:hypothetical protein